MKKNYDFSKMKEVKPSYLKKLKQQVTIKLDKQVVEYFKMMAKKLEVPYQTLINLYLKDCAESKKTLKLNWYKTV
ncbi:MAG: CopG family antitoxin [Bdellovibrionota bacterium]|mgnify:FL=1